MKHSVWKIYVAARQSTPSLPVGIYKNHTAKTVYLCHTAIFSLAEVVAFLSVSVADL